MRHLLPLALLVAVAARAAAEPVTIDRIVAVVNHEVILLSEVKERAVLAGQPVEERGGAIERLQQEKQLKAVLERMIEESLTLQQAAELKLAVEEAEIDRAVEEVKKQNHLDQAQFLEALQGQGYSLSAYRKDLRKQLLKLKVVNTAVRARINVGDEEVKASYEQSARQVGARRQVHARHVLVALPKNADAATVEQKRRLATRVLEEARGGKDFEELVKLYSDDGATKGSGGDLGWLTQGDGLLPEALAEVVFTMDAANEVRGPLQTERGFEVVQLLEKKDGDLRPFAEVKEQIRQQLYSSQLERQQQLWLGELRKKAHLDVRL